MDVGRLEDTFLPLESKKKTGSDTIFTWYGRYLQAKALGEPAINGTVGSLLEDDGSLAVNSVVMDSLRSQSDVDFSSYAPLPGLPEYKKLATELAVGPRLASLHDIGLHSGAVATPGGTGALYLSARTMLAVGDTILFRSRRWSPYDTLAAECGLSITEWPILNEGNGHAKVNHLELESVLEDIATSQKRILSWLNDPAHNPTGISLDSEGRDLVLDAFLNCARNNPGIGVTLFLDTAYAVYADEPYGWSETIHKKFSWSEWPENLLICWGFSASKSHTIYGLRCGAIVFLHPSEDYVNRLGEVCAVTGRGTWSLAPRLPQSALISIHGSETEAHSWGEEKTRLKGLLSKRRAAFNAKMAESELPLMPSDDGYFAFIPCDDPVAIAEKAAESQLYVVPLKGGVRIGICSIASSQVERAAEILIDAWRCFEQ
ncbi:MAG: pyridoxal phosphate-dependent aminotransferase [Euryarchaeota archaeon]|nr:pyridoxal phosphate-dependent aminotransferase [Euryarchaeota archaeon]